MTGSLRPVELSAARHLHPLRHGPPVTAGPEETWLSDARYWVRRWVMSIGKRGEDELVDWGVVTTNAVGIVIGLILTSATGGIFYLVWQVPTQQQQIIEQLSDLKKEVLRAEAELTRLQANDRVQDNRLTAIEAKTGHR